MLQPGGQDELRHEHLPSLSGEGTRWQLYQVSLQFVPNQKRRGFHLCLLHFLSLISSLRNWKWQGNYHFILNWSQSMWAGSRHRDKGGGGWGGRGEREEGKKDFGSIWRWFSHLHDVSLEGWGGMEAGVGGVEIALRVFPWCPHDRNQIGRRAASALWLFYLSGSTGFFLACAGPVLRLCGPPVEPARSLSENNKC